MTNPPSRPGPGKSLPTDPLPDDAASPAKPPRKAPRRAGSPVGAPQRAAAPALLVLDAAGMIVPAQVPPHPLADDAGTAPSPDTAPAAPDTDRDEDAAGGADGDTDSVVDTDAGSESETETETETGFAPVPAGSDDDAGPDGDTDTGDTDAGEPASADSEALPVTSPEPAPEPTPAEPAVETAPVAEDVPAAGTLPVAEDVPAADTAATAEDAPVPQSRRERRLAELNNGGTAAASLGGAAPAATTAGRPAPPTVTTSPEATTPPSTIARKSAPTAKRRGVWPALRGFLFLIVIAAIVVGMGTVLSDRNDPTTGPTLTEAHRQAAWAKTSALVEAVAAVEAAGTQPKLTQQLQDTATDLTGQLDALGDGLPPATSSPTTTAAAPAQADLQQLVAGLQANGAELLDNAVDADHAMGRVFAAVGTSQLLRGRALGEAAGLAAAGTPWIPATVDFPMPSGPACGSTLAPRPGPTVDGALRAAGEGEQKAVYAYEAATTRLPAADLAQGKELLAGHQTKLALLNAELQVRCLPTVAPVPGYALAPGFTAAPEAALAALEAELATNYADLAALSTAPVAAPATGSGATGAADPAATGTAESGTAATPPSGTQPASAGSTGATHANTSRLRQISVTWLLDSTQSHLLWGGSLVPLPGVAAEPVTTAP